jgi:DNA-binding response OmpR family regulator
MSKRILVIDDEADINEALGEVLEMNGFTVDSYEDPFLALERFKPHFYDLLILDIKMPEINGYGVYRKIKKLDANMKVCFLTAGEMYSEAYSDVISSVPANCFIQKPVTNEELLKHIAAFINDTGNTH